MKELRKNVYSALYKYVEAMVEISRDAEKTGSLDLNSLHLKQAEINKELNLKFDEAEERLKGTKKKGIFG